MNQVINLLTWLTFRLQFFNLNFGKIVFGCSCCGCCCCFFGCRSCCHLRCCCWLFSCCCWTGSLELEWQVSFLKLILVWFLKIVSFHCTYLNYSGDPNTRHPNVLSWCTRLYSTIGSIGLFLGLSHTPW